jgi:hypothetical protein
MVYVSHNMHQYPACQLHPYTTSPHYILTRNTNHCVMTSSTLLPFIIQGGQVVSGQIVYMKYEGGRYDSDYYIIAADNQRLYAD